MRTRLTLVLILFCASMANAQTQEEIIRRQIMEQQQATKAAVDRVMDAGVVAMEKGDYDQANLHFKQVLKQAKVVPTDLTFYFGKNSYYLDKYKQSIDWLNKYIELKGTKGRFYEECIQLLDQANQAFMALRDQERLQAQEILTSSYDIDCGPSGKVICPVCAGRGVIIQRGAFNDTYQTCPYSDDHGYLTCEEYNKLLRGELLPKN